MGISIIGHLPLPEHLLPEIHHRGQLLSVPDPSPNVTVNVITNSVVNNPTLIPITSSIPNLNPTFQTADVRDGDFR